MMSSVSRGRAGQSTRIGGTASAPPPLWSHLRCGCSWSALPFSASRGRCCCLAGRHPTRRCTTPTRSRWAPVSSCPEDRDRCFPATNQTRKWRWVRAESRAAPSRHVRAGRLHHAPPTTLLGPRCHAPTVAAQRRERKPAAVLPVCRPGVLGGVRWRCLRPPVCDAPARRAAAARERRGRVAARRRGAWKGTTSAAGLRCSRRFGAYGDVHLDIGESRRDDGSAVDLGAVARQPCDHARRRAPRRGRARRGHGSGGPDQGHVIRARTGDPGGLVYWLVAKRAHFKLPRGTGADARTAGGGAPRSDSGVAFFGGHPRPCGGQWNRWRSGTHRRRSSSGSSSVTCGSFTSQGCRG